jgi:hypothetical protein
MGLELLLPPQAPFNVDQHERDGIVQSTLFALIGRTSKLTGTRVTSMPKHTNATFHNAECRIEISSEADRGCTDERDEHCSSKKSRQERQIGTAFTMRVIAAPQ